MSQLAQALKLVPHDNLKSGTISYQFDTETGVLTYQARVHAVVFFVSKDFNQTGSVKIDPKRLQSVNIKPGLEVPLGPFRLTVSGVNGKQATCAVSYQGENISETGVALLNLSGEYLTIQNIRTQGKIYGFSEELELTA